jgi:hypothetical protein
MSENILAETVNFAIFSTVDVSGRRCQYRYLVNKCAFCGCRSRRAEPCEAGPGG